MIIKRLLTICVFLLTLSYKPIAQDTDKVNLNKKEQSLKIYSNWSIQSIQIPKQFDYKSGGFNFNGISMAYRSINLKSIVYEIEAKVVLKNSEKVDESFERFYLHLRYELGKKIQKELFNSIWFQIGGAVKFFHLRENIDSREYNDFKVDRTESGMTLSFLSHININLGKKFYFDINASILSISASYDTYYVNNPLLTENQKNIGGYNYEVIIEKLLRIGVGYKF